MFSNINLISFSNDSINLSQFDTDFALYSNLINVTNFNNPDVNDLKSSIVNNYLHFKDLHQHNSILNTEGKLLDLVMSNFNLEVDHEGFPLVNEDILHPALSIIAPPFVVNKCNFSSNTKSKQYNFKKANFASLYNRLLLTNWNFLLTFADVNLACAAFYEYLYSLFDLYVPLFTPKQRQKFPNWFDNLFR